MDPKLYLLIAADRQHFKIGVATNPAARLAKLAQKINLEESLVFECGKGAYRTEKMLHMLFAEHRLRLDGDGGTEWFRVGCHAEVLAFLEQQSARLGLGTPTRVQRVATQPAKKSAKVRLPPFTELGTRRVGGTAGRMWLFEDLIGYVYWCGLEPDVILVTCIPSGGGAQLSCHLDRGTEELVGPDVARLDAGELHWFTEHEALIRGALRHMDSDGFIAAQLKQGPIPAMWQVQKVNRRPQSPVVRR